MTYKPEKCPPANTQEYAVIAVDPVP